MAPPTPVYKRSDIRSRYQEQLDNPQKYQCQLRSLTQHECTFKVSHEGDEPPEIICLPFKRVFQRCLIPVLRKENEKKVRGQKWVNIEVTDASTNADMSETSEKYGKDVRDFLQAEKDLKKLMESEWQSSLEVKD